MQARESILGAMVGLTVLAALAVAGARLLSAPVSGPTDPGSTPQLSAIVTPETSGRILVGRSLVDEAPSGPHRSTVDGTSQRTASEVGALAPPVAPGADPAEPGGNPSGLTPSNSPTPAPPTGSDPRTPDGVVHFVYFVEADEVYDPLAVELIEQQAAALQQFWYDQFAGTFYLPADGVAVVYGNQVASWYDTTPNGGDPRWYRLMNIRAEVRTKLGIEAGDQVRLVTYPSARIDGRVGANRYGGAWMDGDDITCISGDILTVPYTGEYPADCLTTVAHELGHVYGLGHQGVDEDCMQFGFYLYMRDEFVQHEAHADGAGAHGHCGFAPENRDLIMTDPLNQAWLQAVPGQRR